jgi:uncharacterized protein
MRVPVVLALLVLAGACRQAPNPAHPIPADHTQQVEQWRAKHESDYRRDWVSIAGLYSLKPGPNTTGTALGNDIQLSGALPAQLGTFTLQGPDVRFAPAVGVTATLKEGGPVTSAIVLKDDSMTPSDEVLVGDVRLVIHKSGGKPSLRVRDPNGPLARSFVGFQWFPIDPRYRVVGRFVRDAEPKSIPVTNTYGELDEYKSEGVIQFTLDGKPLTLRPFTTRPKRFYIVFRDASSGTETYEAARFLYADLLEDGTTVLDFNEAYNPPCAFNPYTTCPIPIPENRLSEKVLAGEKAYAGHLELPAKSPPGH